MNLAVIGTGYVGLVSGICFAEMGNHVICIDNDPEKLKKLTSAELTIYEPGLDLLFYRNIAKKRIEFSSDLRKAVVDSEIVMLCLPTPQGEDGSADLKYVFGIADEIGKILAEEGEKDLKIIVNKSTVPVGTAQAVTEILKKRGIEKFEVVSNPEFLREGFAVEDFMKPDRIVIGTSSEPALKKMKALYESFVRQGNPILEMDQPSAEVTKYASNSYLAMRITFMNELANFCEKVGANIDMVRRGMGTDSRIGKRFLFAGIGYGGSCFPKDVNALIKTSRDSGSEIKILSIVDKINANQKIILIEKMLTHYNGSLKGKKFAVWGLAFKPNTDDMREAPSLSMIKKLLEHDAKVTAYDPESMNNARYYLGETIEYAEGAYEAVSGADGLVILTEWNEFRNPDYDLLKKSLKDGVIFDGRNIFDPEKMKELGFRYYSVGRSPVL